jgi:hypothetical protein
VSEKLGRIGERDGGGGGAKIVKKLFANEREMCYIARLVTDDDSSIRNVLTHSYRELLRAERSTKIDCPRYANGQKKPDNGLPPYSIQ